MEQRELRERVFRSSKNGEQKYGDTILVPWISLAWMGGCGEIHTESGECENAGVQALDLSPGFSDFGFSFHKARSTIK
jgi:hypothetical protein